MSKTTLAAAAAAALIALLTAALPACDTGCDEADSAVCYPTPAEGIKAFEVTITTGDDPTTSDIFFCFARKSIPGWTCREMDNGAFYNDFSTGATDRYRIGVKNPIAPGDLEQFRIAVEASDYHHDWNLTALTVVVETVDDRLFAIYHDESIDCQGSIDEGYSYWPRECPY